ncbi:hypothetical protein RSK60_190025 [Ralstonia solanacearum K60]|nr:hypothetical protein RSK60_190025 [Ralstonia solanacearum K60]
MSGLPCQQEGEIGNPNCLSSVAFDPKKTDAGSGAR